MIDKLYVYMYIGNCHPFTGLAQLPASGEGSIRCAMIEGGCTLTGEEGY